MSAPHGQRGSVEMLSDLTLPAVAEIYGDVLAEIAEDVWEPTTLPFTPTDDGEHSVWCDRADTDEWCRDCLRTLAASVDRDEVV